MPLVKLGELSFDADLIAFDKDGTLIGFEPMWGRLAVGWVEHLTAQVGGEELERELYRTMGYDPILGRTKPQSPLVIATTVQLQAIAAATLYRHGVPWLEGEALAAQAFDAWARLPLTDLVRPTGDLVGLLQRLQAVGVRVAVVTTDDRAETVETVGILGINHLVDHMVCGDDGLPSKPGPDMLLAACGRLGIEPAKTAVVGDTLADLLMAERAGAGFKAAVLTGAGEPALLQEHADVVLGSVDEIATGDRS